MNGKLYLVATPIGNLEDITLRAIKTLKEVDLIAAEDTRHTLKLLNHFEIKKTLISYYKQIEKTKSDILIEKLKERTKYCTCFWCRNTTEFQIHGAEIIKCAIKNNIEIVPIPGACAAINAIISSGLDTTEFHFVGFLPVNKKEKKEKLEKIKKINSTLIFYEAPHKLINTLENIKEILGDRNIVLAREITKIHEEFIRGTISQVLERYTEPKGEFVILVEKSKENSEEKNFLLNLSLEEHYKYYEKQGLEKKEIIKKIAKDKNKNKNEIYQYFIK